MASGRPVPARPKCHARLVDAEDGSVPKVPAQVSELGAEADEAWIPIGTCLAHFECHTWLHVMRQLIFHPERNSSNILRADVLSENTNGGASTLPFKHQTTVKRRILPRRPKLDAPLLQSCTIHHDDAGNALIVYTPQLEDALPTEPNQIPFYHPKVRAIAFRYQSQAVASPPSDDAILGNLFIYIVPFACDATFNALRQESHRLSRTVLSLLDTQANHSWGSRHDYQKRVIHDTLVPREEYMDLYLLLKEKHASTVISNWVESTDARKHVFEDIGILAFLILLWEKTFKETGSRPASFVDVGCGNGLLVYLLSAEGYSGFGFDLQARKSWSVWRGLPGGADLRVVSLDAPAMVQDSHHLFPPSSFLIGNHADELTSWLPLLAHGIPNASGFVNVPCCLYELDGKHFGNGKYPFTKEQICSLLLRSTDSAALQATYSEFERGPATQGPVSHSRNVAYLRYISHLHLLAGWHLEKEALRIPSTKNWAFVGRRRVWQPRSLLTDVQDHLHPHTATLLKETVDAEVVRLAEQHGPRWKARLPPGKLTASVSSCH